jgi:hypothetical protein
MKQSLIILLVAFIFIVLPIVWLAVAIWFPFSNTIFLLLTGVSAYAFISYSLLVVQWGIFGYGLRGLLIVGSFVSLPIWIGRLQSLPVFSQSSIWGWLFTLVSSGLLRLVIPSLFQSFTGYPRLPKPIELSFPFGSGMYEVGQGGASEILNYHMAYKPIRYAFDLGKINRFGTRAMGLLPANLTHYATFGDILYSPCNGVISAARGDFPDFNPPDSDPKQPLGNHIMILVDDVKIVMAHLQHGSVLVKVGDTVQRGQAIAKIGNSGNTTEPHLHIHAERGGTPDGYGDGEGIPMRFDGRLLRRNDLIYRSRKVSS